MADKKFGIKLNTSDTLEMIVQNAYREGGINLPVYTPSIKSGYIKVSIVPFKKIGFILDVDLHTDGFNHNLNKEGIERTRIVLLNQVLSDIEMTPLRDKLKVSKTFITCAAYKGDEVTVLHLILSILAEPEYLEEVKI